jgi:hypothetical protein
MDEDDACTCVRLEVSVIHWSCRLQAEFFVRLGHDFNVKGDNLKEGRKRNKEVTGKIAQRR